MPSKLRGETLPKLVALIFPTTTLPVALNVPVTLAPVPVTIKIFALPATEVLIFPSTAGIFILDVPFAIAAEFEPEGKFVKFAPSPETYVKTPPVPLTFPASTLPDTVTDVKVPVDVIFGCAALETVSELVAWAALTKLLPPAPPRIKLPANCTVAFLVSGVPFMSTTANKSLNVMFALVMSDSAVILIFVAIFYYPLIVLFILFLS